MPDNSICYIANVSPFLGTTLALVSGRKAPENECHSQRQSNEPFAGVRIDPLTFPLFGGMNGEIKLLVRLVSPHGSLNRRIPSLPANDSITDLLHDSITSKAGLECRLKRSTFGT